MIGWFPLWKNPILCKNREVMESTGRGGQKWVRWFSDFKSLASLFFRLHPGKFNIYKLWNLKIEVDGPDDLSGFQFGWFLGEPHVNFQGSQHELWGNTSWSQSHSSQCGHECMPDACHFSISEGGATAAQFWGWKCVNCLQCKSWLLGVFCNIKSLTFPKFPKLPRMTSSYLKLFVCCLFVPFFLKTTQTPFPFVHPNKKRRWDETCHCLTRTLSEINSNIC